MKRIAYFLILLIVTSSLFAKDFTLSGIETKKNKVTVYKGKSMQTVSDDNFLISMHATKTSRGIQFSTSITNYSSNDFLFKENCISVYQGIYENNDWEEIDFVPASQYLEQEKRYAQTEEIVSAIALGISAVTSGYSVVTGSGYSHGQRYTYSAKVYSPADAAIATTYSFIALDSIQQNNQDYLSYLENNLLFDSVIPAKNNYNGIFVVDERKGPDYKVILKLSPEEKFTFYFTRSDKDEILNPWKDLNRNRHSVVFGISPFFNHFSAYYLWSRPKGVGLYGGLAVRGDSNRKDIILKTSLDDDSINADLEYPNPLNKPYSTKYDWKVEYDENIINYDSFGLYGGITVKTFPHTWLLAGIGLETVTGNLYDAKLYYRYTGDSQNPATDYTFYKSGWIEDESFKMLFSPQVGVNFILNKFDIGALLSYSIKGKFSFDITAGIAF